MQDSIRQLNLLSTLCSRAAGLLSLCVAQHAGRPRPPAGTAGAAELHVAREVSRSLADAAPALSKAAMVPVELLHQLLLQRCEISLSDA